MNSFVLGFFLLGCITQLLHGQPPSQPPQNLPFEVDLNTEHTGIDNDLMTQVTQGDNFVVSPKPADISQGFSFDSKPRPGKPTTTVVNKMSTSSNTIPSNTLNLTPNPSYTEDATAIATAQTGTGSKKKRRPGDVPSVPAGVSALAQTSDIDTDWMLNDDPFLALAVQDMLQQQELLMNSLFLALSGMPANQSGRLNRLLSRVGTPSFKIPTMPDLQNSMNTNNMDLVEDRVIDDANGKGRIQKFKSKDGTGVMQTITYSSNGNSGSMGGASSAVSSFSSTGQPGDQLSSLSADQPSFFSWPNFPRVPTRMLATMPRVRFY